MRRASPLLLALLIVLVAAGCSLLGGGGATPRPTPGDGPAATVVVELPAGWSGGTIGVDALPPEAIDTLLLIEAGGPFPYDQDGSTFQNREAILPDHPRG